MPPPPSAGLFDQQVSNPCSLSQASLDLSRAATDLSSFLRKHYRVLLDVRARARGEVEDSSPMSGHVNNPSPVAEPHSPTRVGPRVGFAAGFKDAPAPAVPAPLNGAMPWEGDHELAGVVVQRGFGVVGPPSEARSRVFHLPTGDLTELLPAVVAVPPRPPAAVHLFPGTDAVWRWRCDRTRKRLLAALGARQALVCLHTGAEWFVAGVRDRMKAAQRRAGQAVLTNALAVTHCEPAHVRLAWMAVCARTQASLSAVKPEGARPGGEQEAKGSVRGGKEGDAAALATLRTRIEVVTAELAKCAAAMAAAVCSCWGAPSVLAVALILCVSPMSPCDGAATQC